MTLLSRELLELPMKVLFSETEMGVLQDFAHRYRLKVPDNVGTGVVTMVMIAGYLNRKHNPPPAYKNIWEGCIRLVAMLKAYQLALHMLTQNKG